MRVCQKYELPPKSFVSNFWVALQVPDTPLAVIYSLLELQQGEKPASSEYEITSLRFQSRSISSCGSIVMEEMTERGIPCSFIARAEAYRAASFC